MSDASGGARPQPQEFEPFHRGGDFGGRVRGRASAVFEALQRFSIPIDDGPLFVLVLGLLLA